MTNNRENLNGMCFAFCFTDGRLDNKTAAEEMEKLNVKSVRVWQHMTDLLSSPCTVRRDVADRYHAMYKELYSHGITQTVAMSHFWFIGENSGSCTAPHRNSANYAAFLDMYEQGWRTLVKEFPEVTDWETGNEVNHKVFLSCYEDTPFTWEEQIDVAVDMMYRACSAVKSVNPKAGVIMPGLAPVNDGGEGVYGSSIAAEYGGMTGALDRIYSDIESGSFGSTNPRDFFDAICWHPYWAKQTPDGGWYWAEPDGHWVELNRKIYEIAVMHGDEGVPCVLSEFGVNDWGNETESHVHITDESYRLIKEEMPFVGVVHAYRLTDALGGEDKDCYSYYVLDGEGKLHAKKRTYALQRRYGGSGKLSE